MEKEFAFFKMEIATQVTTSMTKCMVKDDTRIQIAHSLKDTGTKNNTPKEY